MEQLFDVLDGWPRKSGGRDGFVVGTDAFFLQTFCLLVNRLFKNLPFPCLHENFCYL